MGWSSATSTRTRSCFGVTRASLRAHAEAPGGVRRPGGTSGSEARSDPAAQPEAIPDLGLRQPGTGQGAVTAPKSRGVQLTAFRIWDVPEGCAGVMPVSDL